MGCNNWAFLKSIEVILCIACLCYKWWTDEEAKRLFYLLEKRSDEWPLQNNVTPSQFWSWFTDVTFGGYVIITIGLFVAHFMGELKNTRRTEYFLLGIGAMLFFGVGCMIITSFDNVRQELFDNALILGGLALFTGFVFIIDICCLRSQLQSSVIDHQEKEFRMKRSASPSPSKQVKSKKSHTTTVTIDKSGTTVVDGGPNGSTTQDRVISELRSSIKQKPTGDPPRAPTTTDRMIEAELTQNRANNVQYGRRNLENRGFSNNPIAKGPSSREYNNAYDYEVQSIRNYDLDQHQDPKDRLSITSIESSNETDTDYDATIRYNKKTRGSQTKRRHFHREKQHHQTTTTTSTVERYERSTRDAQTAIDSPPIIIQSSKISTTDPRKSDSATSDDGFKAHPPAKMSYMTSSGQKFHSTITPSRIEKIEREIVTTSVGVSTNNYVTPPPPAPGPIPASPTDPGYVLHTASKWPNSTPLGPTPFQKWKDLSKSQKPVHSAV